MLPRPPRRPGRRTRPRNEAREARVAAFAAAHTMAVVRRQATARGRKNAGRKVDATLAAQPTLSQVRGELHGGRGSPPPDAG
jgi:hypothetical protein